MSHNFILLQNLGSTLNNINEVVNDVRPVAFAGGEMNFGSSVANGGQNFKGETSTKGASVGLSLNIAPAFNLNNSFSNDVQLGPKTIGLG